MKPVEIPYMGGEGVPPGTQPEDLAGWVQEQDRVPLLLALSLYHTPTQQLDDYSLKEHSTRFGIWTSADGGPTIIGLKGSSLKSASLDLSDDKVSSIMTILWSISRLCNNFQQSVHNNSKPVLVVKPIIR